MREEELKPFIGEEMELLYNNAGREKTMKGVLNKLKNEKRNSLTTLDYSVKTEKSERFIASLNIIKVEVRG